MAKWVIMPMEGRFQLSKTWWKLWSLSQVSLKYSIQLTSVPNTVFSIACVAWKTRAHIGAICVLTCGIGMTCPGIQAFIPICMDGIKGQHQYTREYLWSGPDLPPCLWEKMDRGFLHVSKRLGRSDQLLPSLWTGRKSRAWSQVEK